MADPNVDRTQLPDFDSLPDDSVRQKTEEAAAQPQSDIKSAPIPQNIQNREQLPDFDSMEDDTAKFSTSGQSLLTIAEGGARGLIGPGAPLLENALSKVGVPGISPQEQAGRERAQPTLSKLSEAGAMIAPALISGGATLAESAGLKGTAGALRGLESASELGGYSQASLINKATRAALLDNAAFRSAVNSRVAIGMLRGAAEMYAFHASDEASKYLMDEQSAGDAVANSLGSNGIKSALYGAAFGTLFGAADSAANKMADSQMASKSNNLLNDFGKTWQDELSHPDLATSVHEELNNMYQLTSKALDNEFGTIQLKDDALKKLVPAMNDTIAAQNDKLGRMLQDKITKMVGDPDSYPPRLIKILQQKANSWMELATDPTASSFDVFKNTEALKQEMQYISKFGKSINPLAPEGPFVNEVKNIGYQLRTALEDNKVWGDAGTLQKESNAAYSKLIRKDGPLATFEKRFVTNTGAGDVVNPAAINTYVKQLGKPSLGVKPEVIHNFAKESKEFLSSLDNIHNKVGLSSPIEPVSLAATQSTYGKDSVGSGLAKYLFRSGIPMMTRKALPKAIGTIAGEEAAGPGGGIAGFLLAGQIGDFLEHIIGTPVTNKAREWLVPTILKSLGGGATEDLSKTINYAKSVHTGVHKTGKAVSNVFNNQVSKAFHETPEEKDQKKIKEYIKAGGLNQLIQKQTNQQNHKNPSPSPSQNFAHGGEVQKQSNLPEQPSIEKQDLSENPLFEGTRGMAKTFPTQNMMMQAAKGRISNYLQSIMPGQAIGQLPYDAPTPDKHKEKELDHAVSLSLEPLQILNHVKDGSITPQMMKHFTSMFPELHGHLSKKLMEKITETQTDGQKPNHKTRQGLAMFLGSPLNSSQNPQTINTIQSMYAGNRGQNLNGPAPSRSKQGPAKMSKLSENQQTPDQARTARANA